MCKNFGMAGLIGAAALALTTSVANSATVGKTLDITGTNDCAGYYGTPFDSCVIKYDPADGDEEPLSAVIAKWDSVEVDLIDSNGDVVLDSNGDPVKVPVPDTNITEVNNTVWDNGDPNYTLTGNEFSIVDTGNTNSDGETIWQWTYTPDDDSDPVLKYWAHKQKNAFTLHWEVDATSTCSTDLECLNDAVSITTGTWEGDWSHITWYDTDPDGGQGNNPVVPLPAAGFLFLTALGGLGFFRRFRRVTG